MAATELQVTSMEHDELKQSLIAFLQSTETFGDFNYEGSAINTIVDLLTRDAHMFAYLANMVANESFIASAQKRSNVVAHAAKLSYVPRSALASLITGSVIVTPTDPSTAPATIVMDRGTQFLTSVDGQTYTFTAYESQESILRNDVYTFTDVALKQGSLITNRFVHESQQPITIPNASVDTSTISVVDQTTGDVYTRANGIEELSSTSPVYFLSEASDGRFQIEFGRNIIGREPNDRAVIAVTYINTETDHANGVKSLISGSVIGGYSNIRFVPDGPSYGGDVRESTDSIRWVAPRVYQAQNRAANENDYIPLLKQRYAFIKSGKAWGGEKNDPPKYGTVQISLLTTNGSNIAASVKADMESSVDGMNVGSVTPEIVDPYMIDLVLNVRFAYDYRKTSLSFNDLSAKVSSIVRQYDASDLYEFDHYYNQSKLESLILDIPGITSVSIQPTMTKTVDVLRITDANYEIDFGNQIEPGTVEMTDFAISTTGTGTLYDDDGRLFVRYAGSNTATVTQEVGTVDYDTGLIEFTMSMIQDASTVTLSAQGVEDNVYVGQNTVITITEITTSLLQTQER